MWFIAYKNLFQEKTRLIISVSGVAFAVLLMLLLFGIYDGISHQIAAYPRNNPAEIVVAKEGTKDMYFVLSIIPEELKSQINEIEGVREVQSVIFMKANFQNDDNESDLMLASYSPESEIGAPWKIVDGRQIDTQNEIVVDIGFARKNELQINDLIKLLDYEFEIVGFSDETSTNLAYYGFIHENRAKEIVKSPGVTNFIFADINDGANEKEVAKKIKNELGNEYVVFTRDEFVQSNLDVFQETFIPIVAAMVFIGMLVGIAVIGLTTYTATIDKSKEYGVLKAIGMNNSTLYILVLQQALIATLFGFVVGLVLSYIGSEVLSILITNLKVIFSIERVLLVMILILITSVLATLIPVRRISHIDPAEVFKS